MFSILVSELTAELLEKAEWWAFIGMPNAQGVPMWKEVHQPQNLRRNRHGELYCMFGEESPYSQDTRCFPVTLAPDGTETRLELPVMPDEEAFGPLSEDAIFADFDADDNGWNFYSAGYRRIFFSAPPSPNHYPRLALGGTWVWSTRR